MKQVEYSLSKSTTDVNQDQLVSETKGVSSVINCNTQKRLLHIYYQNMRGLNTKLNSLYNNSLSTVYDCIAVTETWLNNTKLDTELLDNDKFTLFRSDRSVGYKKGRGGGVLLAINTKFKMVELTCLNIIKQNCNYIDLIGAYILAKEKINVIVIYIPTGLSLHDYECAIENISQSLLLLEGVSIIIGDFNCPTYISCEYVGKSDRRFSIIKQMEVACGLVQVNGILNNNNVMLDLVFTNANSELAIEKADDIIMAIDLHHPPLQLSMYYDKNENLFNAHTHNSYN